MAPRPSTNRRPGSHEHWTRVASDWVDWARAPGHDAYWEYRAQFRRFLPPPGSATLDLGCGEGRVARDLTALGHRVTAVDAVEELLDAARRSDSAAEYHRCDATSLPFDDGTFDLVVAYNMLMDVEAMPAALTEAARVLSEQGRVVLSVVHPFRDGGRFSDEGPEAPFVVRDNYFGPRPFEGTQHRNGLSMDFAGWHYSLDNYFAGLREAGLIVTDLREPRPETPKRHHDHRMPMFLWMLAQPALG